MSPVQTEPSRSTLVLNQFNGKPVVSFAAGWMSHPSYSFAINAAELYMVLRSTADPSLDPTHEGPLSFQSGAIGGNALPYIDGNLNEPFGSSVSPNIHNVIPKPNNMSSSFRIYNVVSETNRKVIYWDGECIYVRDADRFSFGSSSIHFIGRSFAANTQWKGQIAELLIYSRSLSKAERAANFTYLATKYSASLVQDSSSFNPNSIGVRPELWLDVSSLTSSLQHSASVFQWNDLSGHNRHFTNSISTGSAPRYLTGSYNSGTMPTLRFVSGSMLAAPVTFPGVEEAPFTFIAVCKPTRDCSVISHHLDNLQFRLLRGATSQSSWFRDGNECPGTFSNTGSFQVSASYQMYVWKRDVGSVGKFDLWMNGGKVRSQVGSPNSYRWNRIGFHPEDIPFVGDIGEIMYWSSSVSDMEIYKLYELYLRPKWSLPNGG